MAHLFICKLGMNMISWVFLFPFLSRSQLSQFFSQLLMNFLVGFKIKTYLCFYHFFRLCTHFYFSLPTEKFLRGQGEKYTWAGKGN